ncbi:hypothetical protein Tco_1287187 [Tanacetum coccineum]
MSEQMINHVNNWEKANKEQKNESITAELERYKERVKTFEQRLNIDLSSCEKMIDVRYVVPTGRVIVTVSIKVPAGYIIPTGRTN